MTDDRQPHRDLAKLRRLLKASPGKMTRTALAEHDARAYKQGWRDAIEAAARHVELNWELDRPAGGYNRTPNGDRARRIAAELRTLTPPDSSRLTTGDRSETMLATLKSARDEWDRAGFPESRLTHAPSEPKPSGATCATCRGTRTVSYCVCGCGLTEAAAVREAMRGPAALNRHQAEANIKAESRPCPDCGGVARGGGG